MPVNIDRGLPINAVIRGAGTDPPVAGDIATVNRTAQVANVAATNLMNSYPLSVFALFGVMYVETIGTGTISLAITFTDTVGTTSPVMATLVMTSLTRSNFSYVFSTSSGGTTATVTYNTTGYVSGSYRFRMRCTVLG